MDKNYGCIMLCDVKTTDKIKNDWLQKQNPMLVSRTLITDENLSEYQLSQVKEKGLKKYNSVSIKLICNLGNDSNVYLNFEMYYFLLFKTLFSINQKQGLGQTK